MYPLGGVFCRRGAAKLVEQGASYSEGYMRYPHGFRQSAFPVFLKSAAKVVQNNEAGKYPAPWHRLKSILLRYIVSELPPIVNREPISFPCSREKIACSDVMPDLLGNPSAVQLLEFRQHLRVRPCGVTLREYFQHSRDVFFQFCFHNPTLSLNANTSLAL